MKFARVASITAIAFITFLAVPLYLAAQGPSHLPTFHGKNGRTVFNKLNLVYTMNDGGSEVQQLSSGVVGCCALWTREGREEHAPTVPPHYRFVDLGTLGGPQSSMQDLAVVLNNRGIVVGLADTSDADPNYPNFNPLLGQDPFIQYATAWQNGKAHNLGTLPGGSSSFAAWITDNGWIGGIAENGSIDPFTGWPATDAVVWKNGKIQDLGNLSGGNEAGVTAINSAGAAVGFAANGTLDQYSFGGWGTQARAFRWTPQTQVMQDLGTLGGPDAIPWLTNEKGQVAGQSNLNSIPNQITTMCGAKVPTVDAFLWENEKMNDLPGLGGICSAANGLNNNGVVVGFSYANGVSFHPVLWQKDEEGDYTVKDLGSFGRPGGSANWINDAGEVVGSVLTQAGFSRAFLWKNDQLMDLGLLEGDTCDVALGINSKTQIIGNSGDCRGSSRPFLWQNGSMYDLSTSFPFNYFTAAEASFINDAGEVAGNGTLPNGERHAYVLLPSATGQ